jgi:hypothetical protein
MGNFVVKENIQRHLRQLMTVAASDERAMLEQILKVEKEKLGALTESPSTGDSIYRLH